MVFIILLSFVRSGSESENDCNFFINKINTGSPANLKNQDFIEIKMLCENREDVSLSSLQGVKIIGISVWKKSMTIDLVANLWNVKNSKNITQVT